MTYPPRCLFCGYVLTGLSEGRCPECGGPFNLQNPATFTTKPLFVRWRFWLPGFILATGGGLIICALLILNTGWGFAVTVATPFMVGAVIGYGCRARSFFIALLVLLAIAAIAVGLFTFSLVGIFCGLVLAGVAIVPAMVGAAMGVLLRMMLKMSSFDQRWHLPALALLIVPALFGVIDRATARPQAIESVVTTVDIPAPVGRAWNAMMFYEEVRHRPPFLLRFGLPRPLRTIGSSEKVGDVKFCLYNKGRLAKQVTRVQPQKLLTFDVVVQDRIENHSVRLTGGSFAFVPLSDHETRIELTTSYEPKLTPRWIWRPAERWAVHTLHRHVLEGMKRKAAEP